MEAPSGQNQVGHELKQHTSRLVALSLELLSRHGRDPGADSAAGRRVDEILPATAGTSARLRRDSISEQTVAEGQTGRFVQLQYVQRTEGPEHLLLEYPTAERETDPSQPELLPLPEDGVVISKTHRLQVEIFNKLKTAAFGLGFERPAEKDHSAFELTEVTTEDDLLQRNTFHLTGEAAPRQASIFEDSEIIAAMEAVTLEIIRILERAVITPWTHAEIMSPLHVLLRMRRETLGSRFRAAIDALLRRVV